MVKSITALQATLVLIMSIGLMNHVIVLPSVLGAAGRDAWVSLLLVGVLYMLWLPMVYWIIKKTGQQEILGWLEKNSHPAAKWLVKYILIILILLNTFVTLYSTFAWVNSTYMIQTPKFVLFIPFIVMCFFAAESGMKTIAIAAGLVLPLVVALGFLIMFANMQYKDYTMLLPIFEKGISPMLDGVVILSGGLAEIFFFVVIQQHVRTPIKFKRMFFLSLFILGINIGPIIGALTEFGPVQAANINNPAYAQWRLLTIGKYLNRLDFFSVYQWLSGAFIRVSLSFFMIGQLFNLKSRIKHTVLLSALSIAMIIALWLPIDNPVFESFTNQYYFKISVIGILFVTFFINIIIFFRGRVNKDETQIDHSR
ncbi:GerAB/ArcD/ProY family transporter [Cytobacillus purgationiresistens]|uniref:Spore germination protein (Amino acid permease) n=1 Tax=Cytobacillus purgationiresistens TaxID=863449 RepID=A0ABU0ANI7_9BACI|nr:endospore germination permease [Cytobacillus purgationiresistens]MDQ0272849.1 spore germination protein (amino acid permease) [Cytobacillus purgationiresistens]